MKQVIFDSSFLMAVAEHPSTWHDDIIEGLGKFEPVLLECVRNELQNLASGQGRRARTARVALELAKEFRATGCGGAGVDDEVLSASASRGAHLATVDSDLARSARGAHVKVISLRSRRVVVE